MFTKSWNDFQDEVLCFILQQPQLGDIISLRSSKLALLSTLHDATFQKVVSSGQQCTWVRPRCFCTDFECSLDSKQRMNFSRFCAWWNPASRVAQILHAEIRKPTIQYRNFTCSQNQAGNSFCLWNALQIEIDLAIQLRCHGFRSFHIGCAIVYIVCIIWDSSMWNRCCIDFAFLPEQ